MFLVGILLASSIGYCISPPSYDTVYDVITIDDLSNTWLENECFDLDILASWNMSDTIWKNNLTVSCASGDADIKCKGFREMQTVNGLKRTGAITDRPDQGFGDDIEDFYGYRWYDDSTPVTLTVSDQAIGAVSSEGNYYLIYTWSFSGQPTWCYQTEIWYKNITGLPYLQRNDSKEVFSSV